MGQQFDDAKANVRSRILAGGDGPVDRFVAIQRAIDLARWAGKTDKIPPRIREDGDSHCPIANALYDALYPDGQEDDGDWIRPPDGS
jgi:hypothetical protein